MKKPWKMKGFWHSIHWSIQQTALAMVAIIAMGIAVVNMGSCNSAMSASGEGELDPDYLSQAFAKTIGAFAIGIGCGIWYISRKSKYLEEHPKGEE